MEKYELVRDIREGTFAVARLMRVKETGDLVAMKCITRGNKIDEKVTREIMNHRSLQHPNIIRFKEVVLTPTHLGIVMEYAAGGDLFDLISNIGKLSEDEARTFFQQLICGVSYSHFMQICHRDLKPENALLHEGRLKICDFGFSKMADVWSCGVILYVMLVGAYPFEDPYEPNNFRKTFERITSAQYKIPEDLHISQECKQLLSKIFVTDPSSRITISAIRNHPWFMKNLSNELTKAYERNDNVPTYLCQSEEEIMKIVEEARTTIQENPEN